MAIDHHGSFFLPVDHMSPGVVPHNIWLTVVAGGRSFHSTKVYPLQERKKDKRDRLDRFLWKIFHLEPQRTCCVSCFHLPRRSITILRNTMKGKFVTCHAKKKRKDVYHLFNIMQYFSLLLQLMSLICFWLLLCVHYLAAGENDSLWWLFYFHLFSKQVHFVLNKC